MNAFKFTFSMGTSDSLENIRDFQNFMLSTAQHNFDLCHNNEYFSLDDFLILQKFSNENSNKPKFTTVTFILDRDFLIENSSQYLDFNPLMIYKSAISDYIAPESKFLWNEIVLKMFSLKGYVGTFQITFLSQYKTLNPFLLSLFRLGNSARAVAIGIYMIENFEPNTVNVLFNKVATKQELRLEKIYHYIIDNLDSALPTTHELAKFLGTNDHTLKEDFRKAFGTSIYQFYITEKLKRAHLYIEQSTIPLNKIAADLGFGTYGNFTKAFRKKYGYAPSEVMRWDQQTKKKV